MSKKMTILAFLWIAATAVPAGAGVSLTSRQGCGGAMERLADSKLGTAVIDLFSNQRDPDQTGLTDALTEFALSRNHPLQLSKRINDLQAVTDAMKIVDLGPDFSLSKEDFDFFQILLRTNLSRTNKQQVVSDVNLKITSAGKGEPLTADFMNGLEVIQKNLKELTTKINALAASHISIAGYREELVYNDGGPTAEPIIRKMENFRNTHQSFTDSTPPNSDEAVAAKEYISAFINGKMPVFRELSLAVRILRDYDQASGTNELGTVAKDLMSASLKALKNYRHMDVNNRLQTYDNNSSLVGTLSSLLYSALGKKQNTEVIMASMKDLYEAGYGPELQKVFESYYYIQDERVVAYEVFKSDLQALEDIRIPDGAGVVGQSAYRTVYAEILFFGFIHSCIHQAQWADKALGDGGGFHNATRVNTAMKEAVQATRIYQTSHLKGPQVSDLDFDRLAEIFQSLIYDNLGHRPYGPNITAEEAFGLHGETRSADQNDPYTNVARRIYRQLRPWQLGSYPHLLF